MKKRLLTAKSTYQTVEYKNYWSNDQSQKCQIFEHLQNKCNRSLRCLYCKRNHQIKNHKCQLFTCKDKQSWIIQSWLQSNRNWWQWFIKAYDISNQLTSYRAQLYDQNKLLFNSTTSQRTASQVKNRKLKFSALTQIKINNKMKVRQCRRKNHQFK